MSRQSGLNSVHKSGYRNNLKMRPRDKRQELIAGLMIKFAGIYILMPRFEWIKEFDDTIPYKYGYYPA